jgi:uncharacterized protein involved in outer membrane biogenesis
VKRWIAYGVLGLLATILLLGVAGFLLLDRFDLGPLAAARASAALGRSVSIAGLHVTPGRWLTIRMKGVKVANIPGGTRPEMMALASLSAEIEAWPLLHGPANIRRLEIDGLSVVLEHGANDVANWRRPGAAARTPSKDDRNGFPMLHEVHIHGSEITDRTSSGHDLQMRFDDGVIRSAGLNAPVRLDVTGTCYGVPVTLGADLQPIAVLRDTSVPYGANIQLASGSTTLQFAGTITLPLDVDGADGKLTLHAPTFTALLAVMGAKSDLRASLELAGRLTRLDRLWVLRDATGKLDDSSFAASTLQLIEGGRGHSDRVETDLAFDSLNLTPLLADQGASKGGNKMPVDRDPDPRLTVQLTARQLVYRGNDATGLTLSASIMPDRIDLGELSLTAFGARLQASGHAEAADKGNTLSANASVSGVDVQQLRRQLGARDLPVTGRLDAQLTAESAGETLETAAQSAHVAAIISMRGGSISRDVVEKASADLRHLFRQPKGMTAIACLLAVVDMRAAAGLVMPLRIRTAEGTIAGHGRFDLNRQTIDMTMGSQSATTSDFALDVPFRISGSFHDPAVRPATGKPALVVADLNKLPGALIQGAQRNPCASPH